MSKKLEWQYRAGIISESTYMKKLRLMEDADPSKIEKDLFPSKLSQVDPDNAKKLANNPEPGAEDKSKGATASVPANTLKVTQTTMDFGKFVGMSIQMMGKIGDFSGGAGGDLGAIVSSDNHIMDGHHRWAATCMVDPLAEVGGIFIDLPGEKLVGVLNVWTIANGGEGKPSDTSMNALKPDAVKTKFIEMAQKGGGFLPSPEEILEKFKANGFDSLEAAAEHVKKNWEATADLRKVEGWMPAKIDMPAIEADQLEKVKADIEAGKLDLNPPYASGVKESVRRLNNMLKESIKKSTGERVGATAGNKEALRKYMAALHINAKEGVVREDASDELAQWLKTPLKAMGAGDPTAKLSGQAKSLVKKGSKDGSNDDDKKISPTQGSGYVALKSLKASQNEVGKEQSLSNVLKGVNATWDGINWGDVDWLVDHMKPGSKITFKQAILGAKTKDGNVVLDGHHRWSQAFILNPLAEVNVAFANASDKTADQTLKAVHLAILTKTGQSKTKSAEGGNLFAGVSTGEINALFKAAEIKVNPETGKPDPNGVAPYVAAVMRHEGVSDVKVGTAKAIQRVKFAIEICAETIIAGAPSRDAMPQADDKTNPIDAAGALAALDSGDVNYNEPLVKEIRKIIRQSILQEVKRLKKK